MFVTGRSLRPLVNHSRRAFSVSNASGSAWKAGELQGKLLGNNVLIVRAAGQPVATGLAERMWFELQRVGKQSSFLSFDLLYPNEKDLTNGLDLFKRTGAHSILAIGSDSLIDYCKLLRLCVNYGVREPKEVLPLLRALSNPLIASNIKQHVSIPLVAIPSDSSANPAMSDINMFLQDIEIVSRFEVPPPDAVIYDAEIMTAFASGKPLPTCSSLHVFLQLFNIFFNCRLYGKESPLLNQTTFKLDLTNLPDSTKLNDMVSLIASHTNQLKGIIGAGEWINLTDIVMYLKTCRITQNNNTYKQYMQNYYYQSHVSTTATAKDIVDIAMKYFKSGDEDDEFISAFLLAIKDVTACYQLSSHEDLSQLITLGLNEIQSHKIRPIRMDEASKSSNTSFFESFILMEEELLKSMQRKDTAVPIENNILKEEVKQKLIKSKKLKFYESELMNDFLEK